MAIFDFDSSAVSSFVSAVDDYNRSVDGPRLRSTAKHFYEHDKLNSEYFAFLQMALKEAKNNESINQGTSSTIGAIDAVKTEIHQYLTDLQKEFEMMESLVKALHLSTGKSESSLRDYFVKYIENPQNTVAATANEKAVCAAMQNYIEGINQIQKRREDFLGNLKVLSNKEDSAIAKLSSSSAFEDGGAGHKQILVSEQTKLKEKLQKSIFDTKQKVTDEKTKKANRKKLLSIFDCYRYNNHGKFQTITVKKLTGAYQIHKSVSSGTDLRSSIEFEEVHANTPISIKIVKKIGAFINNLKDDKKNRSQIILTAIAISVPLLPFVLAVAAIAGVLSLPLMAIEKLRNRFTFFDNAIKFLSSPIISRISIAASSMYLLYTVGFTTVMATNPVLFWGVIGILALSAITMCIYGGLKTAMYLRNKDAITANNIAKENVGLMIKIKEIEENLSNTPEVKKLISDQINAMYQEGLLVDNFSNLGNTHKTSLRGFLKTIRDFIFSDKMISIFTLIHQILTLGFASVAPWTIPSTAFFTLSNIASNTLVRDTNTHARQIEIEKLNNHAQNSQFLGFKQEDNNGYKNHNNFAMSINKENLQKLNMKLHALFDTISTLKSEQGLGVNTQTLAPGTNLDQEFNKHLNGYNKVYKLQNQKVQVINNESYDKSGTTVHKYSNQQSGWYKFKTFIKTLVNSEANLVMNNDAQASEKIFLSMLAKEVQEENKNEVINKRGSSSTKKSTTVPNAGIEIQEEPKLQTDQKSHGAYNMLKTFYTSNVTAAPSSKISSFASKGAIISSPSSPFETSYVGV